jgi:entericidin B
MKTFKKVVLMVVLVGILFGIGMSGCNTFRGAGKDIQRGGEAIENTAEDAQRK